MLWSHISSSPPHSSHAAAVHSQQRRKLFLFSPHPASGWRLFPQGAMKSQSSTFQTLEIYMICSNLKSIEELFYAQYCQHIPPQLNKSPFHLISDIHLTSNCFPKTFRRSSPSMMARGWWRHYLYSFRSGLWAVISELDMCHLVHQAQLNFLDFCVLQKFTLSYAQLLISRKSMQLLLLYRYVSKCWFPAMNFKVELENQRGGWPTIQNYRGWLPHSGSLCRALLSFVRIVGHTYFTHRTYY